MDLRDPRLMRALRRRRRVPCDSRDTHESVVPDPEGKADCSLSPHGK
jgi:hypothetical protein